MAKDEEEHGPAPACNGCIKWDQFGKKCWVYWDLKKECSHFEDGYQQYSSSEDAIKTAIPRQLNTADFDDKKDKTDNKDNKI